MIEVVTIYFQWIDSGWAELVDLDRWAGLLLVDVLNCYGVDCPQNHREHTEYQLVLLLQLNTQRISTDSRTRHVIFGTNSRFYCKN